jgi:hypothetical protein
MPLLVFLKNEKDVRVCNTMAVSFLPVVLRVAVELGVKKCANQGGLRSHTHDGVTIMMDSLIMSETKSSNHECHESIDEQLLQVLKELRVLHLLRKEDIKKYDLIQQLCCQTYFAEKRFWFLVE